MTTRDNSSIVDEWFNKAGGGGMILPDGWFGRPHDGIHFLTSVQFVGDVFRVELDGRLTLEFRGEVVAEVVDTKLVIKGFNALSLNLVEYGGNRRHSRDYTDGVVEFMPARRLKKSDFLREGN